MQPTAGEHSSDEILVERIAAGDKLAMQVLFARHRTNIYRWLLRFVGNETVAEEPPTPKSCQAFEAPPSPRRGFTFLARVVRVIHNYGTRFQVLREVDRSRRAAQATCSG